MDEEIRGAPSLKLAIAQVTYKENDKEGNTAKARDVIKRAAGLGARLLSVPSEVPLRFS